MSDIPTTSTTLLHDLAQDSQHARWGEFVARYRPMMEAFMRERFPVLDADDVIQETLVALCGILPEYEYEPDEKGHFRNYLTGILRNKAFRAFRKERKDVEPVAELRRAGVYTPCHVVPGRVGIPLSADDDEQAWRESILEIALRQFFADKSIADRTKRIFERVAINGEAPEMVAASFKMTRHAVDQAKSRAMAHVRELVKTLESIIDG